MEQHQWQGVVRAMGSPTWAENFDTTALRVEHAKTIDERVNEWCAKLSKTECEQVLQQHGVPATALNEPKELLDSPQFKARKCLERVDIDGKKVVAIDLPFKFLEGSRNGAVAKKDERRITRLRIAEASHVLAMPLAGSILGAMGANVTKLEDPRRLDMYRRRGPYIDDLEGVDRNVFFPGVNHSKRSFVVDMDKDLDTLREILDNSDVLIENLGTERGSRVGLDYLHLNETRPELFSLSSTGFGMTGPWSKYRAYAYNVLTSSGLGYLTQTPSGKPADIDMAWADLQTGFALATLVTAWAVGPHRSVGASIDFSMVELVSSRANEYLAAASEGFETKPEHGENHEFPNAPNSLYATTGGSQWITITVRSDEQWNSLKEALGVPTSLEAKEFSSKVLRQKNQQLLDSAMQLLISDLDGAGLSASLQALGVPASLMLVPDELVADPYLSQEKFFGKVEHPQWGEHCLLGLPWRFFGEPRFPLGSPPELGNANDGG
jgi:crotonobetainyl-CoA:carnitine CoA-transferase CaiB-like acyl-CoA transferase